MSSKLIKLFPELRTGSHESKKITQVTSNDTAQQIIELLADAPLEKASNQQVCGDELDVWD